MRRIVLIAVGLALSFGPTTARADEQGRLATAREIVKVTHAADHIKQIFPGLLASLRPMLLQQAAGNQKVVDDILGRAVQKFDDETGSFVEFAAQVYAKEFSDQDLNNLLAFYNTPTGQTLIGKQPEITKGMMSAGQLWGQQIAQQVLGDYAKAHSPQAPKL